jgi:tRNA nucleotidyltransferase (CCA-adding enzyme)
MKLFHKLTGERMYTELVLMFSEAEPVKVLKRMKDFDLLKFIHQNLHSSTETERLFGHIAETLTWFRLLYLDIRIEKWFVYFLGLLDRLKDAAVKEALERLAVPARVRERVLEARERYRGVLYIFYKETNLPPSRVYDLLAPLQTEAILLVMAKARQDTAKKYISLYLMHLRNVKVTITGDDLRTLGIPPGPKYRKLLAKLLDAKLDGEVRNREEEIEFVKNKSTVR